jgi:hypothetical protein
MDTIALHELAWAYARRKRFEARLIAAEISRIFAEAQEPSEKPKKAFALLREMGVAEP